MPRGSIVEFVLSAIVAPSSKKAMLTARPSAPVPPATNATCPENLWLIAAPSWKSYLKPRLVTSGLNMLGGILSRVCRETIRSQMRLGQSIGREAKEARKC